MRGTLSILLVTASPTDSPRSIKQTFIGLWPIFYVFFCRTKSLKVYLTDSILPVDEIYPFISNSPPIESLIPGMVCKKNTNTDVVAKTRVALLIICNDE